MTKLHKFTDEYLTSSRQMAPGEIICFLEDYRRLDGGPDPEFMIIGNIGFPAGGLYDIFGPAQAGNQALASYSVLLSDRSGMFHHPISVLYNIVRGLGTVPLQ